ncbi:hypothetical protein UB43_21025 [Pseudomonas sp. 21]|uniref:hypothetical protein n=1 Tax=unclassified Pseudomonas TaxID=196821 RepID=UPI0005EACF1E|nr:MULTISPECIES: hypothetical protein [unclassified Pseudomonas]KJJ97988.1 hypothetical protein UB43_21025 [Pseudomonas sp. 21]MBV7586878.1 hypothetical protein [Pseudomonas sp. PDM33]
MHNLPSVANDSPNAVVQNLLRYADELEHILRYQAEPALRAIDRDLAARICSLRQEIKLCGVMLGGGK